MDLFKEFVFTPLKQNIYNAFIGELESQREENTSEMYALKQISQMIKLLRPEDEAQRKTDFYSDLEKLTIERYAKFYHSKSQSMSSQLTASEYLHTCEEIMNSENCQN